MFVNLNILSLLWIHVVAKSNIKNGYYSLHDQLANHPSHDHQQKTTHVVLQHHCPHPPCSLMMISSCLKWAYHQKLLWFEKGIPQLIYKCAWAGIKRYWWCDRFNIDLNEMGSIDWKVFVKATKKMSVVHHETCGRNLGYRKKYVKMTTTWNKSMPKQTPWARNTRNFQHRSGCTMHLVGKDNINGDGRCIKRICKWFQETGNRRTGEQENRRTGEQENRRDWNSLRRFEMHQ